jgi:hypothetical protein
MKWNSAEIMKFYETANKSHCFSSVFCSKMVWNRFSIVFSSENHLDWNSKFFFSSENGSERNSEVFLFRETYRIPTELPFVLSCFVFRGIIFLLENGNPSLYSPLCGGGGALFFISAYRRWTCIYILLSYYTVHSTQHTGLLIRLPHEVLQLLMWWRKQ